MARGSAKQEIVGLTSGPLAAIKKQSDQYNLKVSEYLSKEFSSNPLNYAEKIITYASRNTAIFLDIDNVDQFENAEYQSSIFSDAIALSQRTNVNLILSMRETTYVAHKSKAIFNAFDVDVFQVDPPDIKSVLSKRFSIAKEMLKGKEFDFISETGVKVKVTDASKIIDMIVDSVLNTHIGNLLSILTTGDIRLCLKLTKDFLRHGYSATGKAITTYQRTGYYKLPPHEAFRAILLGGQTVYSEALCPIGNPFDSRLNQNNSQMLRMFILNMIVNRYALNNLDKISGLEIVDYIKQIGFSPDMSVSVLDDLCKNRFIFTVSHEPAEIKAFYLPSRLGSYIVKELLADFVFLENLMWDTFIGEEDAWKKISKLTEKIYNERDIYKKIKIRKDRIEEFFNFLTKSYEVLNDAAIGRSLPSECIGNPFVKASNLFNDNLNKVLSSAKKRYGQSVKD